MLVTFSCREYENITMFGDVAKKLLILMGHSGTIPSAIKAGDIPEALEKLEKAIGNSKTTNDMKNQDEDEESAVSLRNRALPLVNMLKAASDKQVDVMWQ